MSNPMWAHILRLLDDEERTAEQQQGSTHSVWGTEGEGILEMSELWLPGNIFPFIRWDGTGSAEGVFYLGLWLAYG